MTGETKPGDPADKAADGAFGGVTPHATHSHRAGYGDDRLERLIAYLRLHPTATLASGEGALLLAEIDRLRDDLHTQDGWVRRAMGEMDGLRVAAKDSADHYADARAEIDRLRVAFKIERANTLRLERILAALREPSEAVLYAAHRQLKGISPAYLVAGPVIGAAVAAAEQEVGRE